jgi:hypothetical protein
MRISIFTLLLWTLFLPGYSQIIRGTILDRQSKERISFAYVYINGTFIGTNSDKNGDFTLDISKYASMPLTISALGYFSNTLIIVSPTKPLVIYMEPKVFELNEVVINSKTHGRERIRNLRIFKDSFLGTTRNSHDCEILNEKDIMFKTDHDTLKAYSLSPILINNKALGYKVTYFLDEFSFYRKSESFFFVGSIMFNEDLGKSQTENMSLQVRRQQAYLGSRMHFFRLLWNNALDSTNFAIENPAGESLNYGNVVIEEDSLTKYLEYPENLSICYNSPSPSSFIIFLEEQVNFDKNGYFDPYGISWQGEMSEQRIADWLPYEYSEEPRK